MPKYLLRNDHVCGCPQDHVNLSCQAQVECDIRTPVSADCLEHIPFTRPPCSHLDCLYQCDEPTHLPFNFQSRLELGKRNTLFIANALILCISLEVENHELGSPATGETMLLEKSDMIVSTDITNASQICRGSHSHMPEQDFLFLHWARKSCTIGGVYKNVI